MQEIDLPRSDFRRENTLACSECGYETPHRSVPAGGAFRCKGTGWPSTNARQKRERNKKSSQKSQIMVDRAKSGEGVGNLGDLKKTTR